jgi:8-oxo-dGTP pyrophosphatase MutT (NUDIX family)
MIKNSMPRFCLSVLKEQLSRDQTDTPPAPDVVPAGVLVPLFFSAGVPHLLFTQRTMSLKNHRGQISFPGGVKDLRDPDLLATALREAREEVGLDPRRVQVLGALTPVTTITGFRISAHVALIPYPYKFRLNPREVKRLLLFSVENFCDPGRWSSGSYTLKDRTVGICYWRKDGTVIWGATARLLLDLLTRWGENPLSAEQDAACLD